MRLREIKQRVVSAERAQRQAKEDAAQREEMRRQLALENDPEHRAFMLIAQAACGDSLAIARLIVLIRSAVAQGGDHRFMGGRSPDDFVAYHLTGLSAGVEIDDEQIALAKLLIAQLEQAEESEDEEDDWYSEQTLLGGLGPGSCR